MHLAYLGDATIGKKVNIGAGVITCNYDGTHKHPTVVEDGAFVGTDSQLIAPVRVGKDAYVAAGSSITEDVPAESLATVRPREQRWLRERPEEEVDRRSGGRRLNHAILQSLCGILAR
jgi:bifunctional UDP-N-acetylglucosamine pyrophosphorylase/glucosamine-1-phosphate N-acetyltransferase